MKNLPWDEWIPYTEYEKNECDIKLKNGKIIKHVYPNAGKFTTCCGKKRQSINECEVVEIMYRQYYALDLCKHTCN
jgi:hypothetical protein